MECVYGGFKFKRSGLFGNGDHVKVYWKREEIDEFDIDDYGDSDNCKEDYQFKSVCIDWYCEYGMELRRSLED